MSEYDPIDGSPPVSSVPRILQARTLEWVAISFSGTTIKSVSGDQLPMAISTIPNPVFFLPLIQLELSVVSPSSVISLFPSNPLSPCIYLRCDYIQPNVSSKVIRSSQKHFALLNSPLAASGLQHSYPSTPNSPTCPGPSFHPDIRGQVHRPVADFGNGYPAVRDRSSFGLNTELL